MKKTAGQRFRVLPERYAVCRLSADSQVPSWVGGKFVNVTFTEDEVSIICLSDHVPPAMRAERDWRVLKVIGPFLFTTTGVLASFATPLARAKISLLAIATFDTDYVLVKSETLDEAVEVLTKAGHAKAR